MIEDIIWNQTPN